MRIEVGTVAAVTGAASGIGRAIALELARRGCDLALADVNSQGLATVVKEVEALGRKAMAHHVDVAQRSEMQDWAHEVRARMGGAAILVNNAGVGIYGRFDSMSAEDEDWLLGINLHGVLYGCRAFLPQIKERRGHILNVSSMAGVMPYPMQTAYCASKFGVRAFTAGLRAELAVDGVGVTALLPGTIGTPFMINARGRDDHRAWMHRQMMRAGSSPQRVATLAVRAIRKNRGEQPVGLDARGTLLIMSVAPWLPRLVMGLGYRWFHRRLG